jgi:hypothetical protein
MKRKAFLLASLGALCAAVFGRASTLAAPAKKRGGDVGQMINDMYGVRFDGAHTHGWGIGFGKVGPDLERYAVVFEQANETREGFVRKLRMLADAVETGHGAVLGENMLSGNELNALDYEDVNYFAQAKADREKYKDMTEDQKRWYRCFSEEAINATPEQIASERAACNARRMAKRAAKGLA